MLPVDDRIMNIAIQGGAPDQRINTRNFAPQGILIKKTQNCAKHDREVHDIRSSFTKTP